MAKLIYIFASAFILLLTCSESYTRGDNSISFTQPDTIFTADDGYDEQVESNTNTTENSHYKNPLRKKYKTRGRARYCQYDIAPVFYTSDRKYFTERVAYSNYICYIKGLALLSSSLRGPPASSII